MLQTLTYATIVHFASETKYTENAASLSTDYDPAPTATRMGMDVLCVLGCLALHS